MLSTIIRQLIRFSGECVVVDNHRVLHSRIGFTMKHGKNLYHLLL
jgi:hypothetical protein